MLKIRSVNQHQYFFTGLIFGGSISLCLSLAYLVFILLTINSNSPASSQVTSQQEQSINAALELYDSTRGFN
jgi:hypothetical protein